jgi:hypothetical protein
MSAIYTCGRCGRSVSKTTTVCPHCSAILSGIKCQNCGFVGLKTDFIQDRCPRCNTVHISSQPATPVMGICEGCGQSINTSDLTCSHCGYTRWGVIITNAIFALICFYVAMLFTSTILRWGGAVLGLFLLLFTIRKSVIAFKTPNHEQIKQIVSSGKNKRIFMFIVSGIIGFISAVIALNIALGPIFIYNLMITFQLRLFIGAAIIGLITFEILYRTRKWLSLKTLAIYIILILVIGRYFNIILDAFWFRWGTKDFGIPISLAPIISLYSAQPHNILYIIQTIIMVGIAYFLVVGVQRRKI